MIPLQTVDPAGDELERLAECGLAPDPPADYAALHPGEHACPVCGDPTGVRCCEYGADVAAGGVR